jgi:CHAD domain-containing protein
MHRHTELEWQFAATDLAAARTWLASLPQGHSERRCTRQPSLHLHDTYYDSSDWMIYRAGFALRLRHASEDAADAGETELTLKALRAPVRGIARRTEISAPMPRSDIGTLLASAEPIAEHIRALVGTRLLAPLFQAHTRRERLRLLEADSELPLAEIDLDEISIETPAGEAEQLTRVEVECIHAEPAALEPWVVGLRDGARLQPVQLSKFRTGIAAAGLDPERQPDLGSLGISASQDFSATQLAQLRRYFALLLAGEPRVRADAPEAVHQMRVAARHLDVLLRSWRRRGPAWAVRERRSLRMLVRSLGAVRDLDVQIAHLEASFAALAGDEQLALVPMLERLQEQRRDLRGRLLHALDSERVRFWVDSWKERLVGEHADGTAQPAATGAVARELVREQARKLRKRAERIRAGSDPDEYHEVRIRAKRLRYTLDAFEELFGEAGRVYGRALGKLQDILGAYQDATVREQHFAALANDARQLPSATYFAMGRLVERDARAFDRCRRKFSKAYARIRGRRWRALADVMRSQARPDAR